MVEETYNDGKVIINGWIDGEEAIVSIKEDNGNLVEKLSFSKNDKELMKKAYLFNKQISVRDGFTCYGYDSICLSLSKEGIEIGYKDAKECRIWVSLNGIINFLYTQFEAQDKVVAIEDVYDSMEPLSMVAE